VTQEKPGRPSRIGVSAARLSIANAVVLFSSAAVTIVVTNAFGADKRTDAFWVARGTTDFLIAVAVAAGAATIPTLVTTSLERGPEAAQRLGRSLFWAALLVLTLVSVALWLVRPALVNVLGPGFSESQQGLTAELMGFTLPAAILGGCAAILTSISNASHRFFVAAIAPAVANFASLAVIAIFATTGVAAWAAGYLVGMLCALALQVVTIRRTIPFLPPVVVANDLARVLPIVYPYVYLALLLQVGTVAVRVIASSLPEGTLTALSIALTLANIPLGLFGYALATAVVPRFAAVAATNTIAFTRLFEQTYRLLAAVLIPIAAILIALAGPIVQLLFQRGSFDSLAASRTAESLSLYAAGLFVQPVVVASNRALLGAGATRAIAVIGTITVVALVGMSGLLGPPLLHRGIAAAFTLAVLVQAIASVLALRGRFVDIDRRAVLLVTTRALLFGAISGVLAASIAGGTASTTFPERLVTLTVAGLAAALVYVVLLRISRAQELRDLVGVFRREASRT
jgi:putative peptidoglycan lipid II flippase